MVDVDDDRRYSPGEFLREIAADGPMQVLGAPNALAAKLLQNAGMEAVYLSGAALSAGVLGVPDIGLFTLTELCEQTRYLTRSVDIPVIVDADTGFGEPMNVERTVSELEFAGAAAIQLEDQLLPKRCGHLRGKSLVSAEAMCAKLRAAANARADDDLVLIARTDARSEEGLDAAVARARQYLDAGADWIFPEALNDRNEFTQFARQVDAPLVANMTEFGKSPLIPFNELVEMGYTAVLYPVTLLRVAMRAMLLAIHVIAHDGDQKSIIDLMQTRQELYDLLEYEDYDDRDRQHFGRKPKL